MSPGPHLQVLGIWMLGGARTPQLAQRQAARKPPELTAPTLPQVKGDRFQLKGDGELPKQRPHSKDISVPLALHCAIASLVPFSSHSAQAVQPPGHSTLCLLTLFFQRGTICCLSYLLFLYHTPASLPAPIHAANLPHPLSTALSIHPATAALETVWFPWQPLSISGVGGDAAGRMLRPPCMPGAGTQGSISPVEWIWRSQAAPHWKG